MIKKILLIFLVFFSFHCNAADENMSVSIKVTPKYRIEFHFKHTHPFLAEYERRLVVYHGSDKIRDLDYPKDSGGCLPIKISYYEDELRNYIRITDRLYDRLIDLKEAKYVKGQNPSPGRMFTSYVDEHSLPKLKKMFEINSSFEFKEKQINN